MLNNKPQYFNAKRRKVFFVADNSREAYDFNFCIYLNLKYI